jgi:hypothetical protein
LLKILQSRFKNESIPSNGLTCFVGIDHNDQELVEIFEPRVMVTRFIYNCGSKFDDCAIEDAFREPLLEKFLILVTGNDTKMYSYLTTFNLISTVNGLLIKRQKKGGQSSVRFSRLAEESRHVYAERVVDKINAICSSALIFGAQEMKQQILTSPRLFATLRTSNEFSVITDNFVNDNKKRLIELLSLEENTNDTKIATVVELVQREPDLLLFGNEIFENLNLCEYVVTVTQTENPKHIYVPHDSKYYKELHKFGAIGKKYYKW